MSVLSDDERNLLRYYAETEREVALTSTCSTAATMKNGQSILGARGLW
jgi:hypothetical protein